MNHAIKRRREKFKSKWGGGEFNALPRQFTRSNVLRQLGPFESKLLLDLLAQYNGFNNGDLCITWSVMKGRCWNSRTTLHNAKQGLLDHGLIVCTRPGTRRRCALYALTLYDIDECKGKHDVKPTSAPLRLWLKHEPVRPIADLQSEIRTKQARKAQRAA